MNRENDFFLRINTKDEECLIEFSNLLEIEKEIPSDFVLDYDQFKNVIGVEILNLELHAGKNCLKKVDRCIQSTGAPYKYSHDKDTDSFYLNLSKEPSFDQKAVDGKIVVDKKGQIIALKAKVAQSRLG